MTGRSWTPHALAADGNRRRNIDKTYGHLLRGHDEMVLSRLSAFDGCYMAAGDEAAEA